MEDTFLKMIQILSDNRFWILPLLLIYVTYLLFKELKNVFR